jgi:hypothetical protein
MPAAEQMAHLAHLFNSIPWWRLQPAPGLVVHQPGEMTPSRHIAAARSEAGDLALLYIPEDRQVELNLSGLQSGLTMQWLDPRTGQRSNFTVPVTGGLCHLETPAPGDWLLLLSNTAS